MKLLIHGHCFFDLVMLDQNGLGLVELLLEDSQLGLNSEIADTLLSDELVDLSQVVGFGDIAEGSVASLGHNQVLLLDGHLGHSLPVCLCLGRQLKRLKDLYSAVEALVLKGSSELDQRFIQVVRDRVGAIVD